MSEDSGKTEPTSSKYVRLNVGGNLFVTSVSTLTKKETMLSAMFSGSFAPEKDKEGWVCIDRDGAVFGYILNYLRDGQIALPDSHSECMRLLAEARFYCIRDLELSIEEALRKEVRYEPLCTTPLLVNSDEYQDIVQTSSIPVVVFTLNRRNNHYSYTGQSTENLFRNGELFDKLAIKFGKRALFCKNTVSSKEICVWTFFHDKSMMAQVSCTSLVYASDKTVQIKADFPENRIYEEMLNLLLYTE